MDLMEYKIERLQEFKALLNHGNEALNASIRQAQQKNRWFTEDNIWKSIYAIKALFLDTEQIKTWLKDYDFKSVEKNIGIICAGNIPLVGFHDVLCAFLVNAKTKIKLSSKDEILMKFFIQELQKLDITWKVEIIERLLDYDAVIATGSDNSNRYFEQYFKKVPNILRGNRNSIAILSGKESKAEMDLLAHDVFDYFGLGCRNVSKLFIPKDFDPTVLFPHFDLFKDYVNHNLYKDNYDYNRTLLLMNLDKHLANDFVIVKEDESLHSRLATVHYSFFDKPEEIQDYIIANNQAIQVVVSQKSKLWTSVEFGQSQAPKLNDYADNIDTMEFLLSL
jgi:hypothetical protein